MKSLLFVPTLVCLAALTAPAALANPHPNPFSYPYETLPAGKFEAEQYVDFVPLKVARELVDGTQEGVYGTRYVLQTELEYGITDRLEFGWYFQFQQGATADTPFMRFTGVKQRLRYRFAEAGEWPIDVGVYLELAENHDEIELEEKILLAKRFGALNFVANLWIEQEYYWQVKDTKYIYNPTVGVSYELSPRFVIGAEYWARGRFDDPTPDNGTASQTDVSDTPRSGHHYLGPTALLQSGQVFLSIGVYAKLDGLGDAQQIGDSYGKFWVRTIVGLEL